jgi:hypothetical protein
MDHLKLITSVLGILLSVLTVTAQEAKDDDSTATRFSYGAKVGATFSAFTYELEPFTEKKAGVIAGVFAEYRLCDFFAVSVEPAYLQKGALNVNPDFLYDDVNAYEPYDIMVVNKVTSHHVQLPLIFHLKLPVKSCKVVPSLSLGGAAAYTFHVKANSLMYYDFINGQSHFESMDEVVTKQFREWEYSAMIGPRIEFMNTWGDVLMSVDYYLGLSQINKYKYRFQFYNFSSNSWVFTLGFRIK